MLGYLKEGFSFSKITDMLTQSILTRENLDFYGRLKPFDYETNEFLGLMEQGAIPKDASFLTKLLGWGCSKNDIESLYRSDLIRNQTFIAMMNSRVKDGLELDNIKYLLEKGATTKDIGWMEERISKGHGYEDLRGFLRLFKLGATEEDIPLIDTLLTQDCKLYNIASLYEKGFMKDENFVAFVQSGLGKKISHYYFMEFVERGATKTDISWIETLVSNGKNTGEIINLFRHGRTKDKNFMDLYIGLSEFSEDTIYLGNLTEKGATKEDLPWMRRLLKAGYKTSNIYWDFDECKANPKIVDLMERIGPSYLGNYQIQSIIELRKDITDQDINRIKEYLKMEADSWLIPHLTALRIIPNKELEAIVAITNSDPGSLLMARYLIGKKVDQRKSEQDTSAALDIYSALASVLPKKAGKLFQGIAAKQQALYVITDHTIEEVRFNQALGLDSDEVIREIIMGDKKARKTNPKKLPKGRFSDKVDYQALYDDGNVSVGIYCQFEREHDYVASVISNLHSRAESSLVELHLLSTEADFRSAWTNYDVVVYSGHANQGRGPDFLKDKKRRKCIRMGADVLNIPASCVYTLGSDDEIIERLPDGSVKVKGGSEGLDSLGDGPDVFMYMCCRGNTYYRPVFDEKRPEIEFVSTNYEGNGQPWSLMRLLVYTIERRAKLKIFIDALESVVDFNIKRGIRDEKERYKNPGPYQKVMFSN